LRQGDLSSRAHIRCSIKCQGDCANSRARGAIETAAIGRDWGGVGAGGSARSGGSRARGTGTRHDYIVLSGRSKIKIFYGSNTLIDQEQHLALEIPTSRTAHAERERERERTHLQNNIKQSLSN
jgi:hypothetical protein